MAVPKLRTDDQYEDVLGEHIHGSTLATVDPQAAVVAPLFDALIADWQVKETLRIELIIAAARAVALTIHVDRKLDAFVERLVNILERINKDRTSALWITFFPNTTPSATVKPVLAKQLARMMLWLKPLTDAKHKELNALVPELEPLLAEANDAAAAAALAKQELGNFRHIGGWAEHITLANANRTEAYGTLLDVPHQHPELKLPAEYAEAFYLHDTSRRGANKPKTSAELEKDLAQHDEDRKLLEKAITDAKQREADEAAREADLLGKQAELNAIGERSKKDEARRKELEDELAKGKKKK